MKENFANEAINDIKKKAQDQMKVKWFYSKCQQVNRFIRLNLSALSVLIYQHYYKWITWTCIPGFTNYYYYIIKALSMLYLCVNR